MNAWVTPIRRYIAFLAVMAPAASTLAAGCVARTGSEETDEEAVGSAGQAAVLTLAPPGDPRWDPQCFNTGDHIVHKAGWPVHEAGPCPQVDAFDFDDAAASCGARVKYFGYVCTEHADGTHSWTVYYGCCAGSCADGVQCQGNAGVDCGGPCAAACVGSVGCSDGTREGFLDQNTYPRIASCAAAWSIPGVLASNTFSPACGRSSGNDGSNPNGVGCTVADACAAGWHVCSSREDVAASLGGVTSCSDAGSGFFTTRQSSTGCGVCATGETVGCNGSSCEAGCEQNQQTANDLFGCGDLGAVPDAATCGILGRFSHDVCSALPSNWNCGAQGGFAEAHAIVKADSANGGVLCCKD